MTIRMGKVNTAPSRIGSASGLNQRHIEEQNVKEMHVRVHG